jgi:hypothetical protein
MSSGWNDVLIACACLLFLAMISDQRGNTQEDGGRTIYLRNMQRVVYLIC